MKISKKLLGIGVASFGILLSVGGAFALYTQAAEDAQFGISAGAYAGSTSTVTYKINNTAGNSIEVNPSYCDAEGNNGGIAIRPDYPQVKYEFTLGATFANDLPAQSYVMGNIGVSLTNLNSALYNKVTVYASMTGYVEGKIGESSFGGAIINNVVIEDANTVCSGNLDISVAASGVQKLVVWVKFANFSNVALNELTNLYDLDVTWGAVSNGFEPAYIVGNGNQWTKDDQYAMAVNIAANTYEWMYEGLPGTMGEAKVVCGETWCHAEGNHALDSEKNYNVYWTAGGDANFEEQA